MGRDEGGVRPSSWKEGSLDDLAIGLESGAISRGKAIKLGGTALVASALGLFVSSGNAQAQEVETAVTRRKRRRRCRRRGGDFCRNRDGCRKGICCTRPGGRFACCGTEECNCCRRFQPCTPEGRCNP